MARFFKLQIIPLNQALCSHLSVLPHSLLALGSCKRSSYGSKTKRSKGCGTMHFVKSRLPPPLGGYAFCKVKIAPSSWRLCSSCSCWVAQACVQLFATPWTAACQSPLLMGILQARFPGWVAMPSQPRDRTQVSHIVGRFFTIWATREANGGLIPEKEYLLALLQSWAHKKISHRV